MKVRVPTSLDECTVKQYIQFCNVMALPADEASDEVKAISVVAIFCGIELHEAANIEKNDFEAIYATIVEMLQRQQPLIPIWKDYGFIPNLDDITLGEYIDLEKYAASPQTYARLMAVMYRKITNKKFGMYTIEPYAGTEGKETEYMELPASLLVGGLLFFWNLGKDLLKHTTSLVPTEMRETLEADLGKSGDGISRFTQLQEEIISILNELRS